MRKEGNVVGGIFVSTIVTLGNRVRLEVLKAIAKKCSNTKEDMFFMALCQDWSCRSNKRVGGAQRALTFVDAIVKYGGRVSKGVMQCIFISWK